MAWSPPRLHHRLTLCVQAASTNPLGERLSGYDPEAGTLLWAEVRPLTANESYRAQRLSQATTHKITIRWRSPPPANNDRILWRGRWFRVETAHDPTERKEWLELMAVDEGDAPPQG
jgi:SPP1 family predicted phage head-tail adaptor